MSFTLFRRQVGALVYKYVLQRRRGIKCTLCEIVAPIVLAMILLVMPQWAGLDLSVVTQTDLQPFPSSNQPFVPRSDVLMDPFSGNGWGLFREMSDSTFGNSCWCKTLAIVGDTTTAKAFQTFMLSEYEFMKGYYAGQGQPFTSPDYVPGFTEGADSKVTWAECPSANTETFFTIFPDDNALNDYVGASNYGDVSVYRDPKSKQMDRLCGAVSFPKNALLDPNPQIHLRFNLTWNRPAVYSAWLTKIDLMEDARGLDNLVGDTSSRYWYMLQGFVGVQILTQRFFRNYHNSLKVSAVPGSYLDTSDQMVHWQVYPFPAGAYSKSENLELLSNFQFVLIFCFCITVALTVGRVVYERESKLREYMRMMGMLDSAYYVSWLLVLTVTWAIIALGVTGMSFIYAFTLSGFGYIFLFNFLFGLASMSFSLFLSALFTKERMGSIVSSFVFFLLQALSVPDYSAAAKFNGASLLPSPAYVIGVKTIFQLESYGLGVTANTLNYSIRGYTMAQTYGMLCIDIFFWWILYYYLEQVNPFLAGYRRVWYFPVTLGYWKELLGFRSPPVVHDVDVNTEQEMISLPVEDDKYEKVTDENLKKSERENACIKILDLKKKFGSNFFAVNGLNLTMYSEEIFCLLGHNGAGKTTTFSMLTGMIQPSSGSISAFGLHIPKDMNQLRRSMGVCPQHSVLWNELTVREHLLIFAGIRGFDFKEVAPTLDKLITDVGLVGRGDFQTAALSGGMKRKLSVAIAFVGDPKLVFLDEPTSGMDPFARRSTWDLLKRMRSPGRVICISTHYMDEADVLGDRIAIMSQGKIECCGTSMFLKNLYGCGYLLTFVKDSAEPEWNRGITGFIEESLTGLNGDKVRIVSSIGRELIVEVKQVAGFAELLDKLDDKTVLYGLGVESYGISVTNIEEVFLKVSSKEGTHSEPPSSSETVTAVAPPPKSVSLGYQFLSLIERRIRFGIRDRQLFCFQLLLPFLILLVSLGLLLVAIDQTPTPITLEVAPLNPNYPEGNFVQEAPIEAIDELNVWQSYCDSGNGTTSSSSSTTCNLLVPGTPSLTSPFGFQQTLLKQWNYPPNPFFAYSKFYYPSPVAATQLGVWQNASGVHTAALTALGQFNAWASKAGQVQVTIVNDPFPNTQWELQTKNQITGSIAGQMIIIAMTFLPVAVVAFIIMEKEREVKSQLAISGVSPTAYWLSHFTFDVFVSMLSTLVAVIVFWIYSIPMFTSSSTIGGTFGLLLLYGPASTAYAYVVSFFFNRQFMAQTFIALTSFILGNLVGILSYVLQALPTDTCSSCGTVGEVLMWTFRVIPAFSLGSGFYRLSVYVSALNLPVASSDIFGGCQEGMIYGKTDCYSGVGDDLFFLGIMTVVYLAIALLVDGLDSIPSVRSWFVVKGPSQHQEQSKTELGPENEDEDVIAEKNRVEQLDKSTQMLYVNKLRKLFKKSSDFFWGPSPIVHAVDSVSFAADKGQVFGLLGVNGAGKTTTFKMLCGLYCPSDGEIFVLGKDALRNMDHVRRHVGYCPQFDALWDLLSVKEHVTLYAKIRGYSGTDLQTVVKSKLQELDLLQYSEARAGNLSGGNKRKLSVAMALVGDPELVFLDEPSCGMDPFARRGMWRIVESVADKRKHSVIVLTTHSMEEAEALCSRIAIQVDGRFRCLGTCQQIKTRYGEGFELTIRAKTPHEQRHVSDILKDINKEPSQQTFITPAEVTELLLNTAPGRAERFALPSYGVKPQDDSGNFLLIDVVNWVAKDVIFGSVVDFLIAEFKEFQVIEMHGLSIKVKLKKLKIAKIFRKLETIKIQGVAEDFQMSQTSLEQIFNRFASTAKNREE